MFFAWLKKIFEKKVESGNGEQVGVITHYFPKPKVAVVKIQKGKMAVGDTLLFRGHTTNFQQKIESMQVDHKAVEEAGRGKEVGLQVKARVRPHDLVFKI